MNSIYRLHSDELTENFISILKTTYPHKEIEITVDEVMDETEYLMSSPANKLHLETALKNIENRINLVTFPFQSIEPGSIQGNR